MKTIYLITLGLILTFCNPTESKTDQLSTENQLLIHTVAMVDSLLEKKLAVIKQPSYDYMAIMYDGKYQIGFNGELFKTDFADYFSFSDVNLINSKKTSSLQYEWDQEQFASLKLALIDEEEVNKDNFDGVNSSQQHRGYQIISIPIYNEKLDKAVISIEKVNGVDSLKKTDVVFLEKHTNNWIIRKVFEN